MDERQPAQQRRDAGQRGRTGRFASPLGAALGKPDEAPYLDIVYGPRPAVAPRYVARRPTAPATFGVSPHVAGPRVAPRLNDSNLTSIYGVSGSFSSDTVCSTYACGGAINVATVAGGGAPLDGAYIRIGVTLTCAGLTSPTSPTCSRIYRTAPATIQTLKPARYGWRCIVALMMLVGGILWVSTTMVRRGRRSS